MPPRSRRRAAQEAAAARKQEEQLEDDFDFEAEVAGTVGEDVDFESMVADDDDIDFESMASGQDDADFESMVEGDENVDFSEDIDFEAEVDERPARRGRGARGSRRGGDDDDGNTRSGRGARAGTRGGKRSARSKRLSSASERKKAAKSSRKEAKKVRAMSPEEIEARSRARKNGILLTLLMLGIFGAGVGFYFLVMRVPPERAIALTHLRSAEDRIASLDQLMSAKDTDRAEKLIDSVVTEHLAIKMFGFASVPNPDPQNPEIIDVKLARDAFELKEKFESRLPEIVRIREDNLAKKNADELLARLADLTPEAEPDLGALREAVGAFLANPPYPEKTADTTLADRYKTQFVTPVRNMIVEIDREERRRLDAETTDVFSRANRETDIMMREMRYGDALRHIDEVARNEPAASLGPIRKKILDSARSKWESERERATNEYRLSVDPGSAPSQRGEAEQRARKILRDVISKFGEGVSGVDEFVQEARRLQSEFGY